MTHLLQDEMERLYGRDSVNAMGYVYLQSLFQVLNLDVTISGKKQSSDPSVTR